MAFGKKLLGVTVLVLGIAPTAQAATLASANAFACGVEGSGISPSTSVAQRAYQIDGGYPGQSLDPDMPSTVKLRIIYEHPDRIEVDHCGGTVIHNRWIVTAAHCVAADKSWDRVEVIAGDTNLDGMGVIRRTSRDAVCHAGFDYNGLKDDIALIRLDEALPPQIVPARVDDQGTSSARVGGSALAAGWPVTGRRAGDRRLNKTNLSVTEVAVPGYITAISAMGGTEGVCRGESGGPLMAYGALGLQLAGVLSGIQPGTENGSGEECMLAGYEMYFTPIAAFTNWIDGVLAACDHGPSECRGSGSGFGSMLLAAAPSYSGQSYASQTYTQPSYSQVAYSSQPAYQPVYAQVAYQQPAYQQPAYQQPVYQEVATSPIYETVQSYDVAYTQAAPVYDTVFDLGYSQSAPIYNAGYVDTAALYVDTSNTWVPAAETYVPTYVEYETTTPTYIDVTYDYQASSATYQSGYSVAYADGFTFE